MASLFTTARQMYGPSRKLICETPKGINTFRLQLLREFQQGNKTALMTLLMTEYYVNGKQYLDFMGFMAKSIESTMRNHKYFASRDVTEDDLQEVLTRVIGALKTVQIERIENEAAVGSYIIMLIRHNINKYLRDILRLENRGLPNAEWSTLVDVDALIDETEILDEMSPLSPEELYEIETEEQAAEKLILTIGTVRQAMAMLLLKQGKTTKEIAEVMEIDEGTVKVNIAVLKAKLAAYHARLEKR